jgi:hypothetical protein
VAIIENSFIKLDGASQRPAVGSSAWLDDLKCRIFTDIANPLRKLQLNDTD